MNPGIFGLPAGVALAGGSSVRLRKPFAGEERFKDAVRLMQTAGTACKPSRLIATARRFSADTSFKAVASSGTMLVAIPAAISGTSETVSTTIYSSPDGITWTARTLPLSILWSSVCWTGSRFLVSAAGGTQIAWSNDGITWTSGTSIPAATNSSYGGVFAFKGRVFAYKGQSADYYDSTDNGATWSALKTFPVSPGLQSKNVIVTSEFVIVADSSASSGNFGAVTLTTDGINWAPPAGLYGGGQVELAVAARPGMAVALMRSAFGVIQCVVSRDNFATATVSDIVYATQSSHTLGGTVTASSQFMSVGNEVSGAGLTGWGGVFLFSHLGPQPNGNRLFFGVRRSTTDGASQYQSYHLLHTIDGKRWFLEDAVFGTNTQGFHSISHGGSLVLFSSQVPGSLDTTANIRCALLNTDFEELVYDPPV